MDESYKKIQWSEKSQNQDVDAWEGIVRVVTQDIAQ